MTRDCRTCAHLSACKEVTEQQVLQGHSCPSWKLVAEAELKARQQIMRELGSAALRYILPSKKQPSARPSRKRRKRV